MFIKNLGIIAGVAASLGASAALAGNVAPAPAPAPIIAPALVDWSGPFVGAQFGGGFADTDFRYRGATPNAADHDSDGLFGGIYGGYDFQSGANVFGVDLAYNFADITGSTECPNPTFTCSSELEDFGAIRGRYGRAFNDILIYGAAGYAFGDAKADAARAGAAPVFLDNSASVDGWTAALGVQKMLQSGWALRGEVAYYDLASSTGAIVADSGDPARSAWT
ncbi:hypothetical protein DC366_01905 [Pelagivirga sediminicola]|uniref:Outer membrane protein beta-barrel domain-containing protein n=1 Tax=Pelagivirga sediminicola TaxID=2170575 RepID=A0A2T7GBD8_9RHOB|nr:outer membrane beta-barrel protein [Pelagivirga sediminicola]PVA11731.1 hypothetical protein DC366_01905 [Pelagivirga sediminicola]